MNDIATSFVSQWEKLKSKTIIVACSGGVDSMVLLFLLHKCEFKVEAAHVNYQLRGEDSEKDMQLVQQKCAELSIPLHLKRVDLQAQLEEKGGNLQDKAREVRYTFFDALLSSAAGSVLALAHHSDDQVEGFFLNLSRKAGIMGLACMLEEKERFIRPLLLYSKKEIRAYAVANAVEWREDISNQSNKYKRNLLRNKIIPDLVVEIPSLKESVLTLIAAFQTTQLELEEKIKPIIQSIESNAILPFYQFDLMDNSERIEMLRQLALPSSLLNELEKLIVSQKGKFIELGEKDSCNYCRIVREGEHFYFERKTKVDDSLPLLILEEAKELPSHYSKEIIFLDPNKIVGDLKLRYWQQGDRMKLVGTKGSKLISDIINDAKIPNHQKSKVLVLSDEEKILWCVGLKISSEGVASKDLATYLKVAVSC